MIGLLSRVFPLARPAAAIAVAALFTASCGGSGRVTGRITSAKPGDTSPLPGTHVTIDGLKVHEEGVATASGEFVFDGIDPGTYKVKAELPGFLTSTREDVVVSGSRPTSVDFALQPGCLEEGAYADYGLTWTLQASHAILYVTIDSADPPDRWILDGGTCLMGIDHTATVLSILNMGPDSGAVKRTIHIVKDGRHPWKPGSQYIAFLRWETAIGRYRPVIGDVFMIPVTDGKVDWDRTDAPNIHKGDPVSKAMASLFALLPSARAQR